MIIKKLIKSKVLIFSIILILIGFVFMLSISSPEFKKVNSFEIKSFDDGVFKASMNIRFYNGNWFPLGGNVRRVFRLQTGCYTLIQLRVLYSGSGTA